MPIKLIPSGSVITDANTNIIVNTVNCVGIMGAGVALQVKKKYPKMFKEYVKDCNAGLYTPGCIHEYLTHNHIIINLATKDHWRHDSNIEWIKQGLDELFKYLNGTTYSITIPPVGCTNGKLDWNIVKALIYNKLDSLTNEILLVDKL